MILTYERAKKLFDYDPISGKLFNKVQRGSKALVGEESGGVYLDHNIWYRSVCVDKKHIITHRLVWLLCYGEYPKGVIDHLNGDGLDNRIENLRDTTIAINSRNLSLPSTNKSGVLGVYWNKARKKWHAQIKVNGKKIHLGNFNNLQDAAQARKEAEEKYGFINRTTSAGGQQ